MGACYRGQTAWKEPDPNNSALRGPASVRFQNRQSRTMITREPHRRLAMFYLCLWIPSSRRTLKVCVLTCRYSLNKELELNRHRNIKSQAICRDWDRTTEIRVAWKNSKDVVPRVTEKLADHLEGNSLWSQADSWWKMRLTSAICLKPSQKELSCAKSGEVSSFLLSVLPQLPTSLWISWSSFYSDPDHPVSLKQQERWDTCQIWIMFDRKISLCYCLSWELSSIKKITVKTASLSFIFFFFS